MWVKICGMTNLGDALAAAQAGADAIGFIFVANSPRAVTRRRVSEILPALPPTVLTVGVVADEDPHFLRGLLRVCPLAALQFHGEESPEEVLAFKNQVKLIKVIHVKDADSLNVIPLYRGVDAVLLDTYRVPSTGASHPFQQGAWHLLRSGGTGTPFDWRLAVQAKRFGIPIVVAGGITPANADQVICQVQPYGVDVSSGVEVSPGRKDHALVREFILRAKSAGSA